MAGRAGQSLASAIVDALPAMCTPPGNRPTSRGTRYTVNPVSRCSHAVVCAVSCAFYPTVPGY